MPEKKRNDEFLRAFALTFATAGLALLATVSGFAAAPSQAAKKAAAADKPEAMFPHMDTAMGFLQAADKQLKEGEPVFYGHRIAAMKHTEAAIADLQKGINGYVAAHPNAHRNEAIPEPPPSEAGDKYPKMQGALKLLQQAETHLSEAAKIYNGGRVEGLSETRAAVAEIQAGMREAAAHGNK
jgi:hypothetical protein